MNQQPTFFPKQIKLDDYESAAEGNIIRIMETSNLLLGNGGRTSTTAIVMAKALHFMQDEGSLNFQGKQLLELGTGVGLLGVYMGCIGANVILTDLPQLKEIVERNINVNKQLLKGQVQFSVLNWRKQTKETMEKEEGGSTSSSDISNIKALQKLDLTVVCECGGLQDLAQQLKWIGKEGMLLGFMERSYMTEDLMSSHELEPFLLKQDYEFQKIESYHPDYEDRRIHIYKIWK